MFPVLRDEEERDGVGGEGEMNVSSERDCTGLIPAALQSDDELASYEQMYDFLPNAAKPQPRDGL